MNGTFWNRLGLRLSLGLGVAAAGVLSAQTGSAAPQKVPLPKPRPALHAGKDAPKAAKESGKSAVQTAKDILKLADKAVAQAPMQLVPQPSKQAAADPKG